MDIQQANNLIDLQHATYAELKDLRNQIEIRMRQVEQQTLEDIEHKMREFGLLLNGSAPEPQKQKRHRRTKAEIERDRMDQASSITKATTAQ